MRLMTPRTRTLARGTISSGIGAVLVFTMLGATPATAAATTGVTDAPETESVDVSTVATDSVGGGKSPKTDPLPEPTWPTAGETVDVPVTNTDAASEGDGPAASTDDPDGAPDVVRVESLGRLATTGDSGLGVAYTIRAPDGAETEQPEPDPATMDDPAAVAPAAWSRLLGVPAFAASTTPEPVPSVSPTPEPSDEPTPEPTEPPDETDPEDPVDPDPVDVYQAPVRVELSYEDFAGAIGGDWSSRLRAVQLNDCVTVQERLQCAESVPLESVNNTERGTVTVTVPPELYAATQAGDDQPPSDAPSGEVAPASFTQAATTSQTAIGLAAGPGSDKGTYSATSLSLASTWTAGSNTGEFNWSYPIAGVEAPVGPSPELSIDYSSGSVDGRTSSSNNQTSRIGEGFDMDPGFIERSYAPCKDDIYGGASNAPDDSGELCWKDKNLTMSLGGKSGKLVRVDEDGLEWRLTNHDGTIVTRLGTGPNSADRNPAGGVEYWKATTPDGTQYYFGAHKEGNNRVNTGDSTSQVRVYGNNEGETCHAGSFAGSYCMQAWRWSLDYVVDPSGNTMKYFYNQETNWYRAGNNTTNSRYDRNARLLRIEYGNTQAREADGKKAPYQVTFGQDGRCALDACPYSNLDEDTAISWPDVPFDQLCTDTYVNDQNKDCSGRSPSFFTLYRVSDITTQVINDAGTGYEVKDKWTLNHSFPGTGDGSTRTLWLSSIEHTSGTKPGPTVTHPKTTFYGTQLPNRVDTTSDAIGPFTKWRVASIANGVGGATSVNYNSDGRCQYGSRPDLKQVDTNTKLCFPSSYQPDFTKTPQVEFFHKYLVTSVTESDGKGDAPAVVTSYDYVGQPAWRRDESNIVKFAERTWNDWRGFKRVETETGGAGERTWTENVYLRGMDGDRKLDSNGNVVAPNSGNTHLTNVLSTDGENIPVDNPSFSPVIEDNRYTAGFLRRSTTRLGGPGGIPLSRTINTPVIGTKIEATDADHTALAVSTAQTLTTTYAPAANTNGWVVDHENQVDTTYDLHGRPTEEFDRGDPTVATDDRCTTTGYAQTADASTKAGGWATTVVRGETSTTLTTGLSCGAAVGGEDDVIESSRTYYDNADLGQTPTKGLVTKTQSVDWDTGANEIGYRTDATTAYDGRGRPTSVTTVPGTGDSATSTTSYTDNADTGLTTGATATNALGHVTSTSTDRMSGQPSRTTDANGRHTDYTYDTAGRVAAVWAPGQDKAAGDKATATFAYNWGTTASSFTNVTSKTLNSHGDYVMSRVFYDGLMRERQTQAPAASPDGGRVITENWYDSRGQVESVRGPYYNGDNIDEGAGAAPLLKAPPSEVPSYTDTTYDKAGRVTAETLKSFGKTVHATATTYNGSTTTVVPPSGGTVTSKTTNARDELVSLKQYEGATASGSFDETKYAYTRAGKLAMMKNPAGSTWTYDYDVRGLQTRAVDPDRGATSTTYDNLDRPVAVTDANGDVVNTTYDKLGRKTKVASKELADPLPKTRATWVYDTIGSGADAVVAKGQVVSSTRIVATQRDNAAGTDPFAGTYTTALGAVDEATGLPTKTSTDISIVSPAAPAGATELNRTFTSRMSYFDNGLLKQAVQPSTTGFGAVNEVLNYTYDDLDRPRTLTGAGAIVADTVYTPFGEVAQRVLGPSIGRSIYDTFEYADDTRRLSRHWATKQTAADTPVYDARYGYNDAGNITSLSDVTPGEVFGQCFAYDYLQRLTTARSDADGDCAGATDLGTVAPFGDQYTYDKSGNRLSWTKTRGTGADQTVRTHTSSYPAPTAPRPHAVEQVQATGAGEPAATETFDYDQLGNTVERSGGAADQDISWDLEGHQSVVEASGGDTSYAYDADGARLLKHDEATGATTLFLGASEYTITANGTAPVKALTRNYTIGDTPVATRTNTGLQVTIADHHNTPQVTIDPVAATQPVTKRRTAPFGVPLNEPEPAWPNDRGYLNMTDDASTGTTHLDAREYDPLMGRFLSVDPLLDLLDPQQANGYTYAKNSPISMADPTGLMQTCGEMGAACSKSPKVKPKTGSGKDKNYTGPANNPLGSGSAASKLHGVQVNDYQARIKLGVRSGDYQRIHRINLGIMRELEGDVRREQEPLRTDMGVIGDVAGFFLPTSCLEARDATCAFDALTSIPPAKILKAVKYADDVAGMGKKTVPTAATACSFGGETLVRMADGTRKPINAVKVGDKVAATDPETGEQGARAVQAVFVHEDDVADLFAGGERISTTVDHPFWSVTEGRFKRADELANGEDVLGANGRAAEVSGFELGSERTALAYNLSVEGIHTYHVGRSDLLVHNVCPLSKSGQKKLGSLVDQAESTAADAIKRRGGGAGQINRLQTGYEQKSLAELAQLAVAGDREAEKAIKMVKQAGSQGKGGK